MTRGEIIQKNLDAFQDQMILHGPDGHCDGAEILLGWAIDLLLPALELSRKYGGISKAGWMEAKEENESLRTQLSVAQAEIELHKQTIRMANSGQGDK